MRNCASPELAQLREFLPEGTVIDGEVLAYEDDAPLSFIAMQKRIGRKTIPNKLLAEVPVILMAYDLLEQGARTSANDIGKSPRQPVSRGPKKG